MGIRNAVKGFMTGLVNNGTSPVAQSAHDIRVIKPGDTPGIDSFPKRYTNTWMGPGRPPMSAEDKKYDAIRSAEPTEPRAFQYIPNVNTTMVPRASYNRMLFADLYMFATTVPEIPMCIDLIIDEMCAFELTIKDTRGNVVHGSPYQWMIDSPDGYNAHDTWLSLFMYNKLMYDAACSYLRRNMSGKIVASRPVDGSTIFVMIDDRGNPPEPPTPAFQQYLWGTPRTLHTTKELWYKPSKRDTQSPYGYTAIEKSIEAVTLLKNLWGYEGAKYISGNFPEMFMALPESFGKGDKTEAILEFEDTYNDRMIGGAQERAGRLRMVPFGTQVLVTKEITFNQGSYDAAVNIVRQNFGIVQSEVGEAPGEGLGGKGYQDVMTSSFYRRGLRPNLRYVASHFNDIIKLNGDSDKYVTSYEFPKTSIDPAEEEGRIIARFVQGVSTRDETRQDLGKKPLGGEQGNYIVTPGSKGADDGTMGGLGINTSALIPVKKMIKVKAVDPLQKSLPGLLDTDAITLEQAQTIAKKYKLPVEDYAQFTAGLNEEMEHAETVNYDVKTIACIVMDHLAEDDRYYSKLDAVMQKFQSLRKFIGVDPGDDQYYGAAISADAAISMPHEGANESLIVSIGGNGMPSRPAVWKPASGEKLSLKTWVGGDLYRRAEAAYLLDRELATDQDSYLVPVAYVAEHDDETGSIQMYVTGRKGRKKVDTYKEKWIERAAVLDYVMGQMDRDRNNWLTNSYDEKRPVLIDNDCSFPVDPDQKVHSQFVDGMRGKKLSNAVLDSLFLLLGNVAIWDDLQQVLGDAKAVENAKARAQKIYDEKMLPAMWVKVKRSGDIDVGHHVEVVNNVPVKLDKAESVPFRSSSSRLSDYIKGVVQKNHELELEKIDLLKAQETAPTLPDAQVSNPSQSAISDLVKEISRQNDLRELEKASSSGITKYQGENDMQRVVLEFPAPIVNVPQTIVNVPEQPAPVVNVAAPIINFPEQKAPIVNVPAPIVNVAAPIVNIPETVVNVEAPVVNVAAPDIKVDAPVTVNMPEGNKKGKAKKMVITRDIDGKISGMEEER